MLLGRKGYILKDKIESNIHESAPCYHCSKYIKNIGIKRIFWSNNEGKLVSCNANKYNTNHISKGNRNK